MKDESERRSQAEGRFIYFILHPSSFILDRSSFILFMRVFARRNKPPIGTPLDYGCPLARGLVFFFPLWEGGGPYIGDVAGGLQAKNSSTQWATGSDSVLLKRNGGYSWAVIPAALQFPWPISIAFRCRHTITGSGNPRIFGLFYSNPDATPFDVLAMHDSSTATLRIQYNKAGSNVQANTSTTMTVGGEYTVTAVVTTTSQVVYVNGANVFSSANSIGNPNYTATSSIGFGDVVVSAAADSYYWGAVWNRALSADEHALLVTNPWQLFTPAWPVSPLTYVIGRGAGQIQQPACDRTGSDRRIWAD
jgi:hypothetical protein